MDALVAEQYLQSTCSPIDVDNIVLTQNLKCSSLEAS